MKFEYSLLKKIHEKYESQLKNKLVFHNRFLICFSGIPGSGKSTIARRLEEKYGAVRINNDEVRKIIKDIIQGKDYGKKTEEVLDDYLYGFLKNYPFANGLVILDSSIDRRYKKLFSFAKENNFKTFVIGVIASRETAQKRVFNKNKGYEKNFADNIERWVGENKIFNKKVKVDIEVDNEKKMKLKQLFKSLDNFI